VTIEIDWMGGRIPSKWDVYKLKHVLKEEKKDIGGDFPAGSISFGEVVFKDFDNEETLATYRTVRKGQFLINPLNLNYDLKSLRIGLSEIDCKVSPAYLVASNYESVALANYLRWVLRIFDAQHIKTLGAGVRQTVKFEDIGDCRIALPSLDIQKKIAVHLDCTTARIDALVAKKTRFIDLLREKRRALITHAVTKGLDANAPMKDSGAKWLGKVPAEWQIRRLRFVASIRNSNVDKKSYEGQQPVLLCNYTDVYYNERITSTDGLMAATASDAEIEKFKLLAGDVIITKDSETPDDIGIPALVPNDLPGVVCGYHLTQLRTSKQILPEFLFRTLQTTSTRKYLEAETPGVTRYGLDQDTIGSIPVAVPPISVQKAITDYLNRSTARIDTLIAKTERSIELLREHRAAIITAAVTGKIDLLEPA
jgi:type I restriction enzyme S subunit